MSEIDDIAPEVGSSNPEDILYLVKKRGGSSWWPAVVFDSYQHFQHVVTNFKLQKDFIKAQRQLFLQYYNRKTILKKPVVDVSIAIMLGACYSKDVIWEEDISEKKSLFIHLPDIIDNMDKDENWERAINDAIKLVTQLGKMNYNNQQNNQQERLEAPSHRRNNDNRLNIIPVPASIPNDTAIIQSDSEVSIDSEPIQKKIRLNRKKEVTKVARKNPPRQENTSKKVSKGILQNPTQNKEVRTRGKKKVQPEKKVIFQDDSSSSQESLNAIPTGRGMINILQKFNYRSSGQYFYRPGFKPSQRSQLELGVDYFDSLSKLRKFLCLYGIESKGHENVSEEEKGMLSDWVRFSTCASFRNEKEIPEQAKGFNPKNVHNLLMKLGFQWFQNQYLEPDVKPKKAGSLLINGFNKDGADGLLAKLCRNGLPENCNFDEITEAERMQLELFIADFQAVDHFKFNPAPHGLPSIEKEENEEDVYQNASEARNKRRAKRIGQTQEQTQPRRKIKKYAPSVINEEPTDLTNKSNKRAKVSRVEEPDSPARSTASGSKVLCEEHLTPSPWYTSKNISHNNTTSEKNKDASPSAEQEASVAIISAADSVALDDNSTNGNEERPMEKYLRKKEAANQMKDLADNSHVSARQQTVEEKVEKSSIEGSAAISSDATPLKGNVNGNSTGGDDTLSFATPLSTVEESSVAKSTTKNIEDSNTSKKMKISSQQQQESFDEYMSAEEELSNETNTQPSLKKDVGESQESVALLGKNSGYCPAESSASTCEDKKDANSNSASVNSAVTAHDISGVHSEKEKVKELPAKAAVATGENAVGDSQTDVSMSVELGNENANIVVDGVSEPEVRSSLNDMSIDEDEKAPENNVTSEIQQKISKIPETNNLNSALNQVPTFSSRATNSSAPNSVDTKLSERVSITAPPTDEISNNRNNESTDNKVTNEKNVSNHATESGAENTYEDTVVESYMDDSQKLETTLPLKDAENTYEDTIVESYADDNSEESAFMGLLTQDPVLTRRIDNSLSPTKPDEQTDTKSSFVAKKGPASPGSLGSANQFLNEEYLATKEDYIPKETGTHPISEINEDEYNAWVDRMIHCILPDDSWSEIMRKMTEDGLKVTYGEDGTKFECVLPGKPSESQNGKRGFDYMSDELAMQHFVVEKFGWKGDADFLAKERSQKGFVDELFGFTKSAVVQKLEAAEKSLQNVGKKLSLATGESSSSKFKSQVDQLNNTLTSIVSGEDYHQKRVLYVCGSVGVGKTTSVKWCCNQIENCVKKNKFRKVKDFSHCLINGNACNNKLVALRSILKGFKLPVKNSISIAALKILLKTKNKFFILVIDEIDMMVQSKKDPFAAWNEKENFLHQLVSLASDTTHNFALIGISNVVEPAQMKRLQHIGICDHRNKISFAPYKEEDLITIIKDRIGTNVICDSALKYAAKTAASKHGDAREMIELIASAIRICADSLGVEEPSSAETEKPIVTMKHMAKAIRKTIVLYDERVKALPELAKLVLCVAVSLCKAVPSSTYRMSYLRKYCSEVARKSINRSIDIDDFQSVVQLLVDQGLLVLDDKKHQPDITSQGIDALLDKPVRFGLQFQEVESVVFETLESNTVYGDLIHYVRNNPP